VPFLDHELVELAARIPPEHKLRHGGKGILKDAARQVIPGEVIDRKKGYFPVPALKYIEGPISTWCATRSPRRPRASGICSGLLSRALFADPAGHITPLRGSELWQVGLLELWLQNHGIQKGHDGHRPSTASRRAAYDHRLKRMREQGMKPPLSPRRATRRPTPQPKNAAIDCGWGRLLFGQTFGDAETLAEAMRRRSGARDIAFYIRDPHVMLAAAPQELFLDPSHTYRLDLATYRASRRASRAASSSAGWRRRRTPRRSTASMPSAHGAGAAEFFWSNRDSRALTYFVVARTRPPATSSAR
jgi:hypothetical protein